MERGAALCDLLYQDILTDIYVGKLRHGDKLPTLMELCEKYGVGRNTARAVVQRLTDDGFVRQANRKQALVVFDFNNAETRRRYLEELARRKKSLADVFQAMALLMPEVAAFCVGICTNAERQRLGEMCSETVCVGIHSEQELFIRLFEVYRYAVSLAHNEMLKSLFETVYSFILVPLSVNECADSRFQLDLPVIRAFLKVFRGCILTRNYGGLKKQFAYFCVSSGRRSERHLARICDGMCDVPESPFLWLPRRGRELLYASLVADLLKKMLSGVYSVEASFPSYAELASSYQVSEKTSRKALAILNKLGIVQTSNGKRAQVASFPISPERLLEDPFAVMHLTACFEAVQMMAIFCRPIVLEVMERIGPSGASAIAEESQDQLESVMDPFFRELSSPCVQDIYRQIKRDLVWCHLLECLLPEQSRVMEYEVNRMRVLLRGGEADVIAEGYRDMYLKVFGKMQAYVSCFGFKGSIRIGKIP